MLCNPAGGRVRNRLGAIRERGKELGGSLYREADAPAGIEAVLDELLATEVSTLCVIGGDGTLQAVLTVLDARRERCPAPALALVAGGTTNMTARDLGVGGSPLHRLRRLGDGNRRGDLPGRRIRRPVLRVERGDRPSLCGMFFGIGLATTGVRYFERKLRRPGLSGEWMAGLAVARTVAALAFSGPGSEAARAVECAVDEEALGSRDYLLGLVTTLDRLLFRSRPYWGLEEGPLHTTLVETGAHRLWRNVPRLIRGRPPAGPAAGRGYRSHNARAVELSFAGPFVIDGEIHQVGDGEALRLTSPFALDWWVD